MNFLEINQDHLKIKRIIFIQTRKSLAVESLVIAVLMTIALFSTVEIKIEGIPWFLGLTLVFLIFLISIFILLFGILSLVEKYSTKSIELDINKRAKTIRIIKFKGEKKIETMFLLNDAKFVMTPSQTEVVLEVFSTQGAFSFFIQDEDVKKVVNFLGRIASVYHEPTVDIDDLLRKLQVDKQIKFYSNEIVELFDKILKLGIDIALAYQVGILGFLAFTRRILWVTPIVIFATIFLAYEFWKDFVYLVTKERKILCDLKTN